MIRPRRTGPRRIIVRRRRNRRPGPGAYLSHRSDAPRRKLVPSPAFRARTIHSPLPRPMLEASPYTSPVQILIADDDDDMRLYVRGCLRTLGFTNVLEAADGVEALRLARTEDVALVISDVLMPGLDGIALCEALRADARTRGIPVLLTSGETRAPPQCADGFLAQPFNTARLRAHVELLLAPPTWFT